MTKRIGLFTPAANPKKGAPSTSTSYVEVDALSDLTAKLAALGAKQVALLARDRVGTTRLEGKKFPLAELKDDHLAWVSGKADGFETRGVFYEK